MKAPQRAHTHAHTHCAQTKQRSNWTRVRALGRTNKRMNKTTTTTGNNGWWLFSSSNSPLSWPTFRSKTSKYGALFLLALRRCRHCCCCYYFVCCCYRRNKTKNETQQHNHQQPQKQKTPLNGMPLTTAHLSLTESVISEQKRERLQIFIHSLCPYSPHWPNNSRDNFCGRLLWVSFANAKIIKRGDLSLFSHESLSLWICSPCIWVMLDKVHFAHISVCLQWTTAAATNCECVRMFVCATYICRVHLS